MFVSKLLFFAILVNDCHSESSNVLRIGTVLYEPYVFQRNDSAEGEHVGFIIDLLDKLKSRMHFQYSIQVFDKYGTFNNATNQWDGLIGDLIKNQNDPSSGISMAAAALSITAEREAVVNFVKPLHHIGNSFLMRKRLDRDEVPYHVTVFKSFSVALWVCVLLACILTAVLLWLMNTFNPHDYGCRYSLGLADKTQSQLFDLKSSFWFCFYLLLWQGYERSPRSIGSKIMAGSWMTFVTITLCFFIGSLTSLMMYKNFVPATPTYPKVKDLYHLITSAQGFKIGTIRNSQTYQQLTSSRRTEATFLKKYWAEDGAGNLVDDLESGLKRVSKDVNYALVVDTLTAQYWANKRPCNLAVVGSVMDRRRSIGLALPIDSMDVNKFHEAIHTMVESGEMEMLENLWFYNDHECWNESKVAVENSERASIYASQPPSQTDVTSFWGAFVFMIVGLLSSCVVALAEILAPKINTTFFSRQLSRHGQTAFPSETSEDGFM